MYFLKKIFITLFLFNSFYSLDIYAQDTKELIYKEINTLIGLEIVKTSKFFKEYYEKENKEDINLLFGAVKYKLIDLSERQCRKTTKQVLKHIKRDNNTILKLINRNTNVDYEIKRLAGEGGTLSDTINFINNDLNGNICSLLLYDKSKLKNYAITVYKLTLVYLLKQFKIKIPKLHIYNIFPMSSGKLRDIFLLGKMKRSFLFISGDLQISKTSGEKLNIDNRSYNSKAWKKGWNINIERYIFIPGAGYVRTKYADEQITYSDNGMDCVGFRTLVTEDFIKRFSDYISIVNDDEFNKGDRLFIGSNHVGICSNPNPKDTNKITAIHCARRDDGTLEGIVESDYPKEICTPSKIVIKDDFLEEFEAKTIDDLKEWDLFYSIEKKKTLVVEKIQKQTENMIFVNYYDENNDFVSDCVSFNKDTKFYRAKDTNLIKRLFY